MSLLVNPGIVLRGKDHLGETVAVPQIDENHPAQIASSVDPAVEGYAVSDMLCAEFSAGMSALVECH